MILVLKRAQGTKQMTTFTASACYHVVRTNDGYDHFPEQARSVHAYCMNLTAEQAQALAAKFPKFVKVKAYHNQLSFRVSLSSDGVNKGANETGAKRIRKFLEIAQIEWECRALNGYKTVDDFLANI